MYHVRGIDTVAPWKRCCSFNVFIYIYIHICIYIYIHAYINKLCVKDNGKSTTIRRREFTCGRSWNDIVGLCCSSFCLNQGQCCSHFVSPLLLLPPSFSFTVNASCARCRLSHVTFGRCAVQTACGQWVGGGRGFEEAVMMSKHCHSPTVF